MLNKEAILSLTNDGLDIFKHYIPNLPEIRGNKTIKNFPAFFREEKTPSANIYKNGSWNYKDFADDHLTAFDFVMKIYNLSFAEVLQKINADLCLGFDIRLNGEVKKDWSIQTSELDLSYWNQYDISIEVLKKNKVYSVSEYNFVSKSGKSITIKNSNENPIFAYKISEDCYKIYQPNNKEFKFVWLPASSKPENYIFGFQHLPEKGKNLLIAAGEKDCMTLQSQGFNAISLNSETSNLPIEIAAQLKSRFKNIIVCYDIDVTGLKQSEILCKEHGFKKLTLPLELKEKGYGKDVSDYFKALLNFELAEIINIKSFQKLIDDLDEKSFIERVESFLFDVYKEIPIPEPVISIEGNTLATAGNLFTIVGQSKSGKTGVISGIIGGSMAIPGLPIDTVGFNVKRNEDKLILHVDTEQSNYNHHKACKGILFRTGRSKQPEFFKSVLLRQFSINEKIQATKELLIKYAPQFGGVHLIVIDGIADYVSSPNEEQESIRIVHEFEKLAIEYKCPVIVVLHLNPSSQEKSRGHLGSQLERKSETVLSITKEKESEISTIESKFLRNAGNVPMIQFKYDTDKGYHVTCGIKNGSQKTDRINAELREYAIAIFENGKKKITYSDLVQICTKEFAVKERSAKDKIALMKSLNIIENEAGKLSPLRLVQ